MSRRSIATTPDLQAFAEAMARPGMDTRVWASYAVVTGFGVDPERGAYVDIIMLPDRISETAQVPTIYGGKGFGLYVPMQVGTMVLVIAPSGTPDAGLQVMAVIPSESDPPPAEAGDYPDDIILRAEEKTSVRIITSGDDAMVHIKVEGDGGITLETTSGDIVVNPGSGTVLLGGDSGTDPVALDGDDVDMGLALDPASWAGWASALTARVAVLTPPAPPLPPIIPPTSSPTVTASATKVEAK